MAHIPPLSKLLRIKSNPGFVPPSHSNISQHTVTFTEPTDNADISSLNSHPYSNITGSQQHSAQEIQIQPVDNIIYICPHRKAQCPRYPLDDQSLHDFAHWIMRQGGVERFPVRSHHYFVHQDIYDPRVRALNPVPFSTVDFIKLWGVSSIRLDITVNQIEEETEYRGVVWRLSPNPYSLENDIFRGTTFIINGVVSSRVKYYATIHRHINQDYSLIQLNAITINQHFCEYNNPDWPTLLLSIPNKYCKVPMPHSIIPYFSDFVSSPTVWNTMIKGIRQMNRSSSPNGHKWDIEIIRG